MRGHSFLSLALAAAALDAAGPAEVVKRALPEPSYPTRAGHHRAAVCSDNAVWLFWHQGGGYDESAPDGRSRVSVADSWGLFCRLIDWQGKDILPPRRLAEARLTKRFGGTIDITSSAFIPVATKDGSALLFATRYQPSDEPLSSAGSDIIAIDRRGKVSVTSLDVRFDGWRSLPTGRMSDWFWNCYDRKGELHCLFEDSRRASRPLLGHLTFSQRGRQLAPVLRQSLDVVEVNARRHLRCVFDGPDYSGIALAGGDTLIVAHARRQGRRDPDWGNVFPGDTLTVYRLRIADLTLIDSTRVFAGSVAGTDYAEARVSRSLLQRTSTGFSFFVPKAGGTASYELDHAGKPMTGARTAAVASPYSAFTGRGTQLISIRNPYLAPLCVDWFGVTEAGVLCYDSAVKHE